MSHLGGGGDATGIEWVEARDAAVHPTVRSTASPLPKTDPAPTLVVPKLGSPDDIESVTPTFIQHSKESVEETHTSGDPAQTSPNPDSLGPLPPWFTIPAWVAV